MKAAPSTAKKMNQKPQYDWKGRGPPDPAYRFADLTLHVGQHRLERGGQPIELGRLTYALLVALVEAAPNVLTHDELMRVVWGGRSTTPETVTQRVKLLRDALGDDAQQPRYVGLVRGGGYRLIPPVERLREPSGSAQRDGSTYGAAPPITASDSTAPIDRPLARHRRLAPFGVSAVLIAAVVAAAYSLFGRFAAPDADLAIRAGPLKFEITQLTSSGRAAVPTISPDGQFIAYLEAPNPGDARGLYVRQIGTTQAVPAVPPESGILLFAPTFSPDGKFIDYIKDTPKEFELWRVPLLGGTPRRLRADVWSPIGWSSDKHGAFVSSGPPSASLTTSLIEVDERFGESVLANRQAPDMFVSLDLVGLPPTRPSYSPDSRFIAVAELSNTAPRITVIERATRVEKTYESGGPFLIPQGLGWLSPSTLVLSRPAALGQPSQLLSMSLPDGAISPLTNDLTSYIGVDLDRTRTRLVTTRRDLRTSVWLADASRETATQLVPPTPFGRTAVFMSWAGERLLYDASFGEHAGVMAIPVAGGTPEEVVADAYGVATAPDGSVIVFDGASRDREGLWKVDAFGQRPVRLVPGVAIQPVVTADRAVVFISTRSGGQYPWIVPLDGGEPAEIVQKHANSLDVSPDGRRLAFLSAPGGTRIVLCELPSCSNSREFPFPDRNVSLEVLRWTPDGKALAYVDGEGQNIWAQPIDGGPRHALTQFAQDSSRIRRFAFSPDGRLAFIRASIEQDVVLLEFAP